MIASFLEPDVELTFMHQVKSMMRKEDFDENHPRYTRRRHGKVKEYAAARSISKGAAVSDVLERGFNAEVPTKWRTAS